MNEFEASDFKHTAELLRSDNDAVVSATLSNNLNIILAALDEAERHHRRKEEAEAARRSKLRPLQELADARLAPEYRQPLKTVQEACAAIGWEFVARPVCCGEEVQVSSMLGSAYSAVCNRCDRFIFDVTGPEHRGGAVAFVDGDKFDVSDPKCWVSGGPRETEAEDA